MDLLRPVLATLLSLAPVAALWNEGASLGSIALVGWVTLVQVAFACVPAREGSAGVNLAAALPSLAVAAALDVVAGAASQAVGVRCAVALVALAVLLVAGARIRTARGMVVHTLAVFVSVLLAPAFEVALEVGGVRGARAEWFDACVAAGPLGFAWNSLALGAEVGVPRAIAALAAPVLVLALVQLPREKEPQA